MCRVKAIASSVEWLLRYANCSGSSEAGSTEADVDSDELLKTLAEDGCQSNGPPVIQECDLIFLWYGHNGGFFEACGNHRQREGKILRCLNKPRLVGKRML